MTTIDQIFDKFHTLYCGNDNISHRRKAPEANILLLLYQTALNKTCTKFDLKIYLFCKKNHDTKNMKLISCFVEGLEPWGVLVGILLDRETDPNKCRKTVKFYNQTSLELEQFFEIYSYTIENLEKWFKR